MTPVGENYGYGSFLSAYKESGDSIELQHESGAIDVQMTGTPTGGHVKVVENHKTVIDTDLYDGATADFITSTGIHVVYAGAADRSAVEKAIAGVQNTDLPKIVK